MQPTRPQKTHRRSNNVEAAVFALLEDWLVHKGPDRGWRSVCPLHPDAKNPTSFHVDETGYWRCYACHEHGPLHTLAVALHGITGHQFLEALPEKFNTFEGVEIPPSYEKARAAMTQYETLPEDTITPFRTHCPFYLVSRGFEPKALQRYNIGYDNESNRIVLPMRDLKGVLVGLTYRQDGDEGRSWGPKYLHDRFSKAKHLYGLHLWKGKPIDRLYLTEGQLDTVRLYQLGAAAAAIMGSSVSLAQAEHLTKCPAKQIVLMFDNDDAGRTATNRSIELLTSMPAVGRRLHIATYKGKDPGDLSSLAGVTSTPWTDLLVERIKSAPKAKHLPR